MNRELAKKLKDAGFPKVGIVEISYKDGVEDELWFPHLADLIEAVGCKNFGLCRNNARVPESAWSAFDHAIYDLAENFGDGSTPEEAVANLWLGFNAK